jgi:hypothetical protein
MNACTEELGEFWGVPEITDGAFQLRFASRERPPFERFDTARAAGVAELVCHYYSDEEHTMGVYDNGTHTPITPPKTRAEFNALDATIRALMPHADWVEYADNFGYNAMDPWRVCPCEEATHALVSFDFDGLDPDVYEELGLDPDKPSSSWTLDTYYAACDLLGVPTCDDAVPLPVLSADESIATNALSDRYGWLINEIAFVKEHR